MSRMIMSAVACCVLLASASQAAPLNTKDVAKDAKWFAHADLAALAESELMQQAASEWPKKEKKFRTWMQENYGITPGEDLQSLTLFSNKYQKHSGVAILTADFDRQKVTSTLAEKDNVEKQQWQNYTLYTYDVSEHSATDHSYEGDHSNDKSEKRVTTVVADRHTIVCAKTPERVKWALKILDDQEPSLDEAGRSPQVADKAQSALIYAAAMDLNELPEQDGALAVLRQHKSVCYSFSENGDTLTEQYTLKAVDEQVAKKMKEAVEGFIALADVWTADAPKLHKMMKESQVDRNGTQVTITWEGSTGEAMTAFERVAQAAAGLKQKQAK